MSSSENGEKLEPLRLRNYDIIGVVGQGGMSTVYKAMQRSLHRIVAIKELNESLRQDGTPKKRFEREAVAVSSMSHENIVSIYDFFEQNNRRYLVMEYVGGVSLEDILTRCRSIPIDIAVMIMLQVARALEYTHAMGLVHRDIKPSNIMINHEGVVKLMDFGVVYTAHWENLTMPGTFVGTPRYMPPEQIKRGEVDFRSDIFSAGIIFYEMVTGRTLFEGNDKTEIFYKITRAAIRRPSRLRPGLPGSMTRAILKCLKRDPKRRYSTTQQLRRKLEQFLDNQKMLTMRQRIALFLRDSKVLDVDYTELTPTIGPEIPRLTMKDRMFIWLFGPERFGLVKTSLVTLAAIIATASLIWWQNPWTLFRANPENSGGLKVVATPWAQVYVNGRLREVTPFEEPIIMPRGYNKVVLQHPALGKRSYEVPTRSGEIVTLAIDFRGFIDEKSKP